MAEAAPPPATKTAPPTRRWLWPGGLSARLLVLTSLFVTLAALFVLPAALASFEEQWLLDRVRSAELAVMATEVAPDGRITQDLSRRLLDGAGVVSVAIQTEGLRRLVLAAPRTLPNLYLVDLRDQNPLSWFSAPFQTLFGAKGRMVRVVSEPRLLKDSEFIDIVVPDDILRAELISYLWQALFVTVFAAIVVGGLVYLSLNAFLVRPMQRITRSIERFRADPEDPAARVETSGRRDEIGRAEAELERMQLDLVAALNSRARLAALGEAVAKINHDLRNMLTSAQIASDRLAAIGDPKVAQAMPRLERALDRAVTLATNVLAYGRTGEAEPDLKPVPLKAALEAAAEDAALEKDAVLLKVEAPARASVTADPDQLHRILMNLMRNARQAMGTMVRDEPGQITVSLVKEPGWSILRIADNGPGLPERALAHLFQPFAGSARHGGTGLGLAISRELAQAHGGDLTMAATGPEGTVFELRLPEPEKAKTPKA
ncbi:MAG: HAMP domain-containing histidine kinase [Caulobacteraceae bacterium]|nr:MAG: HAMP domain-containing histidine kinase [Caulobacteraceae bacterium]